MRVSLLVAFVTALLFTPGCSDNSGSTVKKDTGESVEPVTGQTALWRTYQVARSWAPDAQILKMNTILVPDAPRVAGKAGAWETTFVSAAGRAVRSYTYSVVEGEGNLHKGVFPGSEQPWSGAAREASPFAVGDVKIDTDAAYNTAKDKTSAPVAKSANRPITFLLEKTARHDNPVWRVIWGETLGSAAFSVTVDAVTGEYIETLR